MRFTRAGIAGGVIYLAIGLGWLLGTHPPGPAWLIGVWMAAVALAGSVLPGIANQVSLVRAYLVAPALSYSLGPGGLRPLAVVVAIASLSDLVDGTIARRFDRPSNLGGGLDPVVDGLFMGAVAVGLALGGFFPLWLALVVVLRYLLPAVVGGIVLGLGRRPELRHTVSGQISTTLILILLGGIALFRGLNQDSSHLVTAAEVVIPIAGVATFVQLALVARRSASASRPENQNQVEP